MSSLVIDTNAFIRFFLNDIPEKKKQFEKLLKEAKEQEATLFVPQVVIFEINFVLLKEYKIEKKIVIEKLNFLLTASYFTVESKDLFLSALMLYSKSSLSLPDCFIFCKAQAEGAQLFTFDKKLQKLATSTI